MSHSHSSPSSSSPPSAGVGLTALLGLMVLWAACFTVESAQAEQKGAPGEAEEGNGAPEKPKNPTACVSHTVQAKYVSGYDHLVHIKNDCEKSVFCAVSTNVNPKAQQVQVASKSTQTVLTYRGSPAREFSATVDCKIAE